VPTLRTTRITTTPDTPAPPLECLTCHQLLEYRETVLGGVHPPERWDYLKCQTCGLFQYRHRTRKLTAVILAPTKDRPQRRPPIPGRDDD
jgi:hypothetical protein